MQGELPVPEDLINVDPIIGCVLKSAIILLLCGHFVKMGHNLQDGPLTLINYRF